MSGIFETELKVVELGYLIKNTKPKAMHVFSKFKGGE